MISISLPKENQYPPFYGTYIKLITRTDYSQLIEEQSEQLSTLYHSKDTDWLDQSYADGKWTPKEILGHIIDTERIMTFRALCISRFEETSLPGFDQDSYVWSARSSEVLFKDLLEDFIFQRKALLSMIKTLTVESLDNVGEADGKPITPKALLWIIPGHLAHHLSILEERY